MFGIGKVVVYGSRGVFRVLSDVEMDIAGQKISYHALQPLYSSNSTVYVPTDNKELISKIRPTLTKEQLEASIKAAEIGDFTWIDNDNLRRTKFKELLSLGEINVTLRLIKLLKTKKQELTSRGKKLRQIDERHLEDALSPITEEMQYAGNISREKAEELVNSLI